MTTTIDHDTYAYEQDTVPQEAPKTRRRHIKRTDPMHTHPIIGPELAAEVRLHAANVEADAEKDGADPRVTAARVQKLRRWAAEIEAGLEGEEL